MAAGFLIAGCGSERGPQVLARSFRPSDTPIAAPRKRPGTTPLQALVRLLARQAAHAQMAADTGGTPGPSSPIDEQTERTR